MAFISPKPKDTTQLNTQDDTQNNAQHPAHDDTHNNAYNNTYDTAQEFTQQETHIATQQPREGYIRTQGRKGHKKPRINLAFDSDALLKRVRKQAEKEGKSITQLMNEAIIIYMNNAR